LDLAQWVKNYDPARIYFAVVQGGRKDLENPGLHKAVKKKDCKYTL
jgi:hypothetical protein